MDTQHPESRLSLEEQRENVRNAIRRAMSHSDPEEVERLEGHLIELDNQIKEKNNGKPN